MSENLQICEEQKESLSVACVAWWRLPSHPELQIPWDADSACDAVGSKSGLFYTAQGTKHLPSFDSCSTWPRCTHTSTEWSYNYIFLYKNTENICCLMRPFQIENTVYLSMVLALSSTDNSSY